MWAVTDALASLVGKSMIQTDTGPEGAIRYTMLETLRQYAREQLDDGTATPTGAAAPSPGTRTCSLATSAWA